MRWALLFYARIDEMATEIYKINYVYTVDDKEIEITPLKIKYLRQVMSTFDTLKVAKTDNQKILIFSECVRITMKQYCPEIKTVEDVEDSFDIETMYDILDYSAGIKINPDNNKKEEEKSNETEDEKTVTWEDLDLAKLESEVFLLGIWKDYDDLESSLSLVELMTTIANKRDLDYEEKKFLAALQGVNLDEQKGGDGKAKGQKEWEDLKARVFSGGKTTDSRDILALQGINAQKAGFGIGMGLDYEDSRDTPAVI